jgi:hypothetical protein
MKKASLGLWCGAIIGAAGAARADVTYSFNGVPFTFSGYVDAYYVDDFADTPLPDRQITPSGMSPDYSHSRKDRLAVNHALLDAKFATNDLRGALGVQSGTYVQKNYASEDRIAQHLFEAQVGFRPEPLIPFWVDAGIFASHIGLESAVGKDNWTTTRSLMADNTPYFESGVKFTWDLDARWEYTFLLLQGWQQIGSKNSHKAIGTQVRFQPRDGLVFNSSTYFGQSPNSPGARLRRYFHDFYATWQVNKAWALALATDVGADERSPRDRSWIGWASMMALVKWQFASRWAVAGRVEHYHDPHGLTVATGTRDNLVATGASLNLDCQPDPHVLLRVEVRTLGAQRAVFVERGGLSDSNSYATASITFSL